MTAITDPSRLSALLKYFKSLSILRDIWHIKGLKRESEISGETLRSTIRTSQQPKSNIRAQKLDKTAIRCGHRIRRSVKISL